MAAQKTLVLVTGANAGIGFELAAQLALDSTKHVLLGSRSIEKGEAAVKEIQSRQQPGIVELLQIDVASEDSISAAAKAVGDKHGRLDVLVNNAAVGMPPGTVSERMSQCFQTNTTSAFLTVEAFLPLLKKSVGTPRIINVSSGGGSIQKRLPPMKLGHASGMWGIEYMTSKAGMNFITAMQAHVYGEQGIKVFAYTPGFTISNLGPYNSAEYGAQPTADAATPMVKVVNGERDDEHGCFLSAAGQYPW